jgi:23S rRNA pseudouridine1911/1915/1917 synthase
MPLGRLPWDRKKFGVVADGRESFTEYTVAKEYLSPTGEILTLVHAFPKTGRTHQIRVHMRHIGFPIFADSLYVGRKNSKRDRKLLNRHFLHASKISFVDPRSQERLIIESPLPPELVDFLSTLTYTN